MKLRKEELEAMEAVLGTLRRNAMVRRMKRYVQHGRVSTYEHCERVAALCCLLNRRLKLGADEGTLLRSAMLHDFFLYDWHRRDGTHRWHGFRHPDRAAENALRYCGAGAAERKIIRSHMWPLTVARLPATREAWLVCLADKCCTLSETVFHR